MNQKIRQKYVFKLGTNSKKNVAKSVKFLFEFFVKFYHYN